MDPNDTLSLALALIAEKRYDLARDMYLLCAVQAAALALASLDEDPERAMMWNYASASATDCAKMCEALASRHAEPLPLSDLN